MDAVGDLALRLSGEGKAERTINEYVKWCRRLARWCVLHGLELETLEPHQVRRWIDATVPPGRESRKQAYTAVKHLYLMLGRQDAPWEAIRVPAKRRGDPDPLPPSQARLLRDTAILVGGRKGVATLGLLYTACRPSEVACWRWDGMDDERGGPRVKFWRQKVRDWHWVPMHPTLSDAIERWRPGGGEGHVFPGDRGRPHVTPTTVWEWARQVGATAGLERVNPRRLRATAASTALEATGDIDAVAQLLGHQDVRVTRTYYTSTSDARLRATVASLDW